MTSAMASLDSSMPPRTLCSAATSCGGVRPNSSRGPLLLSSSARDTAPLSSSSRGPGGAGLVRTYVYLPPPTHLQRAASRCLDGRSRLVELQTPLWEHLGTTWGQAGDNSRPLPTACGRRGGQRRDRVAEVTCDRPRRPPPGVDVENSCRHADGARARACRKGGAIRGGSERCHHPRPHRPPRRPRARRARARRARRGAAVPARRLGDRRQAGDGAAGGPRHRRRPADGRRQRVHLPGLRDDRRRGTSLRRRRPGRCASTGHRRSLARLHHRLRCRDRRRGPRPGPGGSVRSSGRRRRAGGPLPALGAARAARHARGPGGHRGAAGPARHAHAAGGRRRGCRRQRRAQRRAGARSAPGDPRIGARDRHDAGAHGAHRRGGRRPRRPGGRSPGAGGPPWRRAAPAPPAAGRAGLPLLVRTLALRAAILVTTYAATAAGPPQLGAHQVVTNLWGLLALALDAVAIAAQALTGTALGAGDVPVVRATTATMVRWGVGCGVLLGVLLAATAPLVAPLFSDDPVVRSAIVAAALAAAVTQPIAGYVFVLDGVLIGAGDGTFLALAGVVQTALYAPLALVVAHAGTPGTQRLVLLWVAFSGAWLLLRALCLGLRQRSDAWLVTGAIRPRR